MADKLRTFVAVEVPGEVQQRTTRLIQRLSDTSAKVKWSTPEQLHWTLKFLGEVDLVEVPDICKSVAEAVAPLAPFDIDARGIGAFPDIKRPRTIWLGLGLGHDQMIALHEVIERGLARLGYREEGRRFRPHITLGRVRSGGAGLRELGELVQQNADFEGGLSTVFDVVVYSSHLGREGPTYDPLGHAELKGG